MREKRSECCKAPVQVTKQDYLDGKGCKMRRVEWCEKCGAEIGSTEYRDALFGRSQSQSIGWKTPVAAAIRARGES